MYRLAEPKFVPEQIVRLSRWGPRWLTFPDELEATFERDRGA